MLTALIIDTAWPASAASSAYAVCTAHIYRMSPVETHDAPDGSSAATSRFTRDTMRSIAFLQAKGVRQYRYDRSVQHRARTEGEGGRGVGEDGCEDEGRGTRVWV